MKLRVAALGAALAATFVLATPSAAQAQPVGTADWSSCGVDAFCMFTDIDGGGGVVAVAANGAYSADLRGWNFNDTISSVWNRTGTTICMYQHANFEGWWITVYPGEGGNVEPGANDQVSSIRPC